MQYISVIVSIYKHHKKNAVFLATTQRFNFWSNMTLKDSLEIKITQKIATAKTMLVFVFFFTDNKHYFLVILL